MYNPSESPADIYLEANRDQLIELQRDVLKAVWGRIEPWKWWQGVLIFLGVDLEPNVNIVLNDLQRARRLCLEASDKEWEIPAKDTDEAVHRPRHYDTFEYEPFEFSVDNNANVFQFNVTKYITRFRLKANPKEDLQKTARVLLMYIKWLTNNKEWAD